jgi:hypothetical protein
MSPQAPQDLLHAMDEAIAAFRDARGERRNALTHAMGMSTVGYDVDGTYMPGLGIRAEQLGHRDIRGPEVLLAEAHRIEDALDPLGKARAALNEFMAALRLRTGRFEPIACSERGVSAEHRSVCVEHLDCAGLSPAASNEQSKMADRVFGELGAVGQRQPHRRNGTLGSNRSLAPTYRTAGPHCLNLSTVGCVSSGRRLVASPGPSLAPATSWADHPALERSAATRYDQPLPSRSTEVVANNR